MRVRTTAINYTYGLVLFSCWFKKINLIIVFKWVFIDTTMYDEI